MNKPSVDFICPPILPKTRQVELFFKRLAGFSKILIFSPHLDDTVLSMGGLLTELVKAKKKIINYNIYSECSAASTDSIVLRLNLAGVADWREYAEIRQTEDREAFEALGGIELHNLGYVDCLWRHDDKEQTLYQTAFSSTHELDDHIQKLEREIQSLVSEPNVVAFCPLARGHHIDHLIVRDILARSGAAVVYYMDFPYSQKYPEEREFIEAHQLSSTEWPGPYEQKAELLQYYESQHQSLFNPRPFPLEYERFYYSFELNKE